MTALAPTDETGREARRDDAPVVVGVDPSAARRAAVDEAVSLASELNAPVVFVYVRRGPAGIFGDPVYARRLTRELARGRRVLRRALAVADAAGVPAEAEILEGSPRRRIAELAEARGARFVVVGSRKRALGRSVSRGVVRGSRPPVVVAGTLRRHLVAH